MKKIIALLLAVCMIAAFAGCAKSDTAATTEAATTEAPTTEAAAETTEEVTAPAEAEGDVMSHADYMAAELDSPVCIETYVQAHQSWWDNKLTVYAQSEDGAYFIYNMECSEEDAAKLVPGTKIRVNGYKTEWSGEVEIAEGDTFEILEGSYIAEPKDLTGMLGVSNLIDWQNEKIAVNNLVFEKLEYKGGEPGDDIYLTFNSDGTSYNFCVESYLTGPDSEVYTTAGSLVEGDTVDVEGFLYWYNGANIHITSITVK